MKRIRSILRGREGMTLVELVVGAGLLCLVIGVFSASLRPAAEVSRRTQELNSAELIADDLLETVRSKVETATDYIKCYDNGADVTNKTYAEGFYMGLRAGLHFKIDEAKHTVTATVTIYRDKDLTDKIYSDSLIIDLRYDISMKTGVTATKKPA